MHRYIGILGLIMALMAPASGAQAKTPSPAPLKSLSVVVRDESNVAIADVFVQALDRLGLLNDAQSLTSANGEMRLRLPPEQERVTVVIQRHGFRSRMFEVNPDTMQGALNVVLSRAPAPTAFLCAADHRPGIRVRVTGAVLRDSVAVRAVAQDGAYVDSSSANSRELRFGISLAHERAGTYTITVSAPGYHSWQRRGVRVPLADQFCPQRVGLPQVVEAELTARP
jgi:hypothetical protein